jgi:flagellin
VTYGGSAATTGAGTLTGFGAIDVSTVGAATTALSNVEGWLNTVQNAAATLAAAELRVEIQDETLKNLSDSLKRGSGGITDADMEAASARLQALQVQQQLGVQALSIANAQPQTILSLFQ